MVFFIVHSLLTRPHKVAAELSLFIFLILIHSGISSDFDIPFAGAKKPSVYLQRLVQHLHAALPSDQHLQLWALQIFDLLLFTGGAGPRCQVDMFVLFFCIFGGAGG